MSAPEAERLDRGMPASFFPALLSLPGGGKSQFVSELGRLCYDDLRELFGGKLIVAMYTFNGEMPVATSGSDSIFLRVAFGALANMGPKQALGDIIIKGAVDPSDPGFMVPTNCVADCPYRIKSYKAARDEWEGLLKASGKRDVDIDSIPDVLRAMYGRPKDANVLMIFDEPSKAGVLETEAYLATRMMDDPNVYMLGTALYPEEETLVKVRKGSNRTIDYVYTPPLAPESVQIAVTETVGGLSESMMMNNLVRQVLSLAAGNARVLFLTRYWISEEFKKPNDENRLLDKKSGFLAVREWRKFITLPGLNRTTTEAMALLLKRNPELLLESQIPEDWPGAIQNAVQRGGIAVYPLNDNDPSSDARVDAMPIQLLRWVDRKLDRVRGEATRGIRRAIGDGEQELASGYEAVLLLLDALEGTVVDEIDDDFEDDEEVADLSERMGMFLLALGAQRGRRTAKKIFGAAAAAAASLGLSKPRGYDDVQITTWPTLRDELGLAPDTKWDEMHSAFDDAILQRRRQSQTGSRSVEVLEAPPSYPGADAAVVTNANALAVGFRVDPLVWSFDSLKKSRREEQEEKKDEYEETLSTGITERQSNLLFHTLRARNQTKVLDNEKVGDKNSDRPYTLPTSELFGFPLDGLRADFESLTGLPIPETFVGSDALENLVPRGLLSFAVLSGTAYLDEYED